MNKLKQDTSEYEDIPRKELLREGLLAAWKEGKNFGITAISGLALLSGLAVIHDRYLKHSLEKTIEVSGKVIWILDCDVPTKRVISGDFGKMGYWIGDLITGGKTCVPNTKLTIPVKVQKGASFGYAKNYTLDQENLPNPLFVREVSNVVNALKSKNFRIESINIAPKASPEGDGDANMQLANSRGEYILSEIIRVNPELKNVLKVLPGIIGKLEGTDINELVEIAKRNGLTNPDVVIQRYNSGTISLNEVDKEFVKKLLDRTTEIQVNGKLDTIALMRIMDVWVTLICIFLGMCAFFGTTTVASEIMETGLFSTVGAKRKKNS